MRAHHAPLHLTPTERSVLDQLDVAVIVTDLDGVVTHWNRRAETGSTLVTRAARIG